MPHKCRHCDNIVPDKSQDIFNGCSECDGHKWEYVVEEQSDTRNENPTQQKARSELVDADFLKKQNTTDQVETVDETQKVKDELEKQYGDSITVRSDGHFEINLTQLFRGDNIIVVNDNGVYRTKRKEADPK